MFLTHCVIVLTVLIQPVWSAVNVVQQYRVNSTDGTAQVQCTVQPQPSFRHMQMSLDDIPPYPYPDPKELRVTLLKGLHGNQELCSSFLNITGLNVVHSKTTGHVQCNPQVKEGAVEVMVSGLKPTDTDIYRCEIQIFYPPPFLRLTGNGTLIHILDSSDCSVAERQLKHQSDEEDEDGERKVPLSLPVAVLMTVVILVLIVIIYLQTVQCLRGRRETIRRVTVANMFNKMDTAGFSYQNTA